jgi:conjugal transfer pilus assembly protein TraD
MTTASWVSDLFDETIVKRINTSVSQGTESEAHALEFRGSISRSEQRERLQRVPPYLLTNLPDCQFFASIGGKKIMGRVPIIN